MLYQAAKYELQSPPPRVSLLAIAIEAAIVVFASLTLVWLI